MTKRRQAIITAVLCVAIVAAIPWLYWLLDIYFQWVDQVMHRLGFRYL